MSQIIIFNALLKKYDFVANVEFLYSKMSNCGVKPKRENTTGNSITRKTNNPYNLKTSRN